MSYIDDAVHHLHEAEAALALAGHAAAGKARELLNEVKADAESLNEHAWTKLKQAEADAKAAAGPVVAEVEQDAHDLAAEAKADVAQVITDAKA